METEIEIPKGLQALLVLAGENPKERPRSKRAIEVHKKYGRIPVILSGSHAGMHGPNPPRGERKSCIQMQEYMIRRGVKFEDIILEGRSMSTLANFYYSQPIILELGATRVGLITDPVHLKRSMKCARKVFADTVGFIQIPSASNCGFSSPVQEWVLRTCTTIDLGIRKIKDGDYEALTYFMENVDPYHAPTYGNKPGITLHNTLIKVAKAVKKD